MGKSANICSGWMVAGPLVVAATMAVFVSCPDPALAQERPTDRLRPHTVIRFDLNGDGYPDYLVREGEDEFFGSTILIAGKETESYLDEGLKVLYRQEISPYVALVDLDSDQKPEILLSSPDARADVCEGLLTLEIPTEITLDADREYRRLVGSFDSLNFDYGGMAQYGLYNLAITRTVQFVRIEDNQLHNVSEEFEDHFRWRPAALLAIADSTEISATTLGDWIPSDTRDYLREKKNACAEALRKMANEK